MLTLNTKEEKISKTDECTLHETDDDQKKDTSDIELMLFWICQFLLCGISYGYFQHCCHDNGAYPDRKSGVERSHCRTIIFNRIYLFLIQFDRRREER